MCFLFLREQGGRTSAPKITYIEVAPPTPAKKDLPPAPTPNRRVVQTERGELAEKALPDSYLGERTQTVDRQTVGKNQNIRMGQAKLPTVAAAQAEKPRAEKPKATPSSVKDLGTLALKIIPEPKPPTDQPEWASSGANAPSDYIKGVKEGERTALNTQEFIFYGYYQRIRERLDRAWIPILRQKLTARFRSGRHLASESELLTRVVVVLNGQGEVTHVRVTSESGVADLDDAAVSAFNQAGPFPNPPHGIADRDGQIQIPWEFVLNS